MVLDLFIHEISVFPLKIYGRGREGKIDQQYMQTYSLGKLPTLQAQ